jgi:hypothetical protein
MRLIRTFFNSSGIIAKIFFSADREEYAVRFYDGKRHLVDLDYSTNDRKDALYVAQVQISEIDWLTE